MCGESRSLFIALSFSRKTLQKEICTQTKSINLWQKINLILGSHDVGNYLVQLWIAAGSSWNNSYWMKWIISKRTFLRSKLWTKWRLWRLLKLAPFVTKRILQNGVWPSEIGLSSKICVCYGKLFLPLKYHHVREHKCKNHERLNNACPTNI